MSIWKRFVFLLMLTGVTEMLWAEPVYQWTDAQGNKHFSDSAPSPGILSTAQPLTPLPKTGAQFAKPDALKNESTPSITSSRRVPLPSTPYHPDKTCRRQPEKCFSKEDEKICLLRYGITCVELFFWKTIVREDCENNRKEHCDDPERTLSRRPASLQARDLKADFPHTSHIDDRDQQCMLTHGFYCAELLNENVCREYDKPCDTLRKWVERSQVECREKHRSSECEGKEFLQQYRPRSLAEIKFIGIQGGSGTFSRRIIQDYLIIDSGVNRNDPQYGDVLQRILNELPGF